MLVLISNKQQWIRHEHVLKAYFTASNSPSAYMTQSKKRTKTLIFPPPCAVILYLVLATPPPHTHATIAEARNPLTKSHSVIICLVQECFTFWCYNSFVCSSFGQANHRSRVSMRENKLLENKGWELQGFFPASQFSHQPGSASHMLLCWPDKMMTRYNHTL